jgi:hypothetical protein
VKRILFLTPVLFLAACGGPTELTPQQRDIAEIGALKFSQAAGASFVGCSGQDSNNDSYVTCTMKKPTGDLVEALCSYKSQGCKSK